MAAGVSSSSDFNPRSREGSDYAGSRQVPRWGRFQSTLPRGERQMFSSSGRRTLEFQSTLPRGERQRSDKDYGGNQDFNPRSREGSDRIPDGVFDKLPAISIHAPARGATSIRMRAAAEEKISIHAPARGATGNRRKSSGLRKFQSTLPRGERQLTLRWYQTNLLFQSTLPRGERQICVLFLYPFLNFNPRSREGSDRCPFKSCKLCTISIHAPARGATKPEGSGCCCDQISIHAPARGATCGLCTVKYSS